MLEQIKTILLVTLIAALIWIWAEGESFSSAVVNPRVSFVTTGPELEITPDENWRGTVRLRLEGSTVAIKQAEQLLGTALVLRPPHPGVPSAPGDRQTVNLVEVVKSLPQVRQLGITVLDVDPTDVTVNITKYVQREMQVKPQFPSEIELLGEPTVIPSRVSVRMPEHIATGLTDNDIIAPAVASRDVQAAKDESPQSVILPLPLPTALQGIRGISMNPEQVNATFRVRKNVDTITLPSVPVWVSIPPTETSSWDIELKDTFLRDVVFTGPRDQIRKLRDRTFVPIAEVQLSSDELESGITTKEAVIVRLLPGVDYTMPVKTVDLSVKRRSAGPDAPSPITPRGPSNNDSDDPKPND
jgi:hypothetical protein